MARRGAAVNTIDRLIEMDHTSPKTILVVGDGMTDIYIHGRLETGQERCFKFVEEVRVSVPGGAANAARSLEHWHTKKVFVYPLPLGPTKARFMVDGKCAFRHDNDAVNFDLDLVRRENLYELDGTRQINAVLISDYDKGLLTPEFIRQIIDRCNSQKIPVVVDAKREPSVYAGALLKCNAQYAYNYRGKLGQFLPRVVTCGARRPIGGRPHFIDLPPVKCVNHVGAGDCFAAHLALALAYGIPLEEAATVAHSAGRVYVQHPHNRPPHLLEVKRDIDG